MTHTTFKTRIKQGKEFLDITSKAPSVKGKVDILDIQRFCCVKNTAKTMKKQVTDWEKNISRSQSQQWTCVQNVERTLETYQ